jgi:hypothetical protein
LLSLKRELEIELSALRKREIDIKKSCIGGAKLNCHEDIVFIILSIKIGSILQRKDLQFRAYDIGFKFLVGAFELVLNSPIVNILPVDDVEHDIEVRVVMGFNQFYQPHFENA